MAQKTYVSMYFGRFSNFSYAWHAEIYSTFELKIDYNMTVSSDLPRIHFNSYVRYFSIFFFLESCGFSKVQK